MQKRLGVIFCGFCIISMVLLFRLYGIATDTSLSVAQTMQSTYTIDFNKTRAQIYDCKLNPLTDTKNKTMYVGIDKKTGKPNILNQKTALQNPKEILVPIRTSQNKELCPHIIGYLDDTGNGVTGIEKAYNDFLNENSQTSSVSFTVDSRFNPLKGIAPKFNYAPILSNGVVLTIDSRIQEICEEIGEKLIKKGAIVVMQPQTGKLNAVASFPSYQKSTLEKAVYDKENSPLINRAFCPYNVGSTFKVVTCAQALSQGISADTSFSCFGEIDIFGQKFGCHQKSGHGKLDLQEALKVSCNPYFIQLGLTLDKNSFYNMAKDLSFGKSAELAPNMFTSGGRLPNVSELANPADIANLSFGQGLLTATPVQLCQMMSAVLNGGKTPFPVLVEGFSNMGELIDEKLENQPPICAFDENVAKKIKEYLVNCVMCTPNQKAKPQYITAGGKTGTAQTGQYKKDGEELLQGWFVGFFPADKPKYVVAIVTEDAKSGNENASPVFSQIADKLYEPIFYK